MALIYTCWDTEGDALQFEDAYNDLLKAKYPEGNENVKVEVNGNDVLVLEGGSKESTEALMEFLKQVKKKKPALSGVPIF
ncbi:hypothetical protein HY256_00505 [Candidatus Sumerlaeota bacterium]|nr:hypothetical protein [Candidatus Sumerlaeota bacterium]